MWTLRTHQWHHTQLNGSIWTRRRMTRPICNLSNLLIGFLPKLNYPTPSVQQNKFLKDDRAKSIIVLRRPTINSKTNSAPPEEVHLQTLEAPTPEIGSQPNTNKPNDPVLPPHPTQIHLTFRPNATMDLTSYDNPPSPPSTPSTSKAASFKANSKTSTVIPLNMQESVKNTCMRNTRYSSRGNQALSIFQANWKS